MADAELAVTGIQACSDVPAVGPVDVRHQVEAGGAYLSATWRERIRGDLAARVSREY